jgi:hypothetical protein
MIELKLTFRKTVFPNLRCAEGLAMNRYKLFAIKSPYHLRNKAVSAI